MISPEEYEKLIDEVLNLERKLEIMGKEKIDTSQGPYEISERALHDSLPQQKAYNDLYEIYNKKKKLIDAFDMIARYKLASGNSNA